MEEIGYVSHPVKKFEKEVFLVLDSDVEDLVSSFVTGLSSFHDEAEHKIEDDRSRVDSLFTDDKNYSLNGCNRNFNWILALNRLDQQKPLKKKGENQEPLMAEKKLSCLILPGPKCFLNKKNTRMSETEGRGESKSFDQQPICDPTHLKASVLTRDNSTQQPKSALRGSRKKVGSGSQPKLHVTWAPDVREPACTSVSHTVDNNCDRNHLRKERKQHKHLHKGKSSHGDKQRKQGKTHTVKSMYAVEASLLRAQYARYERNLRLGAATKRVVF